MKTTLRQLKRTKEPSTIEDFGRSTSARRLRVFNRKRILIVDDNRHVRNSFYKALSLMGYEVVLVESGSEGLSLIFETPFDLVLTDLHLLGTDGWTLASRIKKGFPQTPVVLMTAQDEKDILGKIEGSSVDLVMFKPFGLKDIQRMVREILTG